MGICFAQWIGHRGLWPASSWSKLLLLQPYWSGFPNWSNSRHHITPKM